MDILVRLSYCLELLQGWLQYAWEMSLVCLTGMGLCGTVMLSPQLTFLTLTIRCYNLTFLPLFYYQSSLLPFWKSSCLLLNKSLVRTAPLYHCWKHWDLKKMFLFPDGLPFSLVKASNQTQLVQKKYFKVGCKVLNVLDMNSGFRS